MPVQGKVEITVITLSQATRAWIAMDPNFTSSAIQKQDSWVGEQIEGQKVSCAGNRVFLPP